MLELESQEG